MLLIAVLPLASIFCFSQAQVNPSPVTLETSEVLFTVLAAINNCGYDALLASSDPVRLAVRGEVGRSIERSEKARAASDAVCAFYHDHQRTTDALTLSQYISLGLYLDSPPAFLLKGRESDVPPDASAVLGLVPLLSKFYTETGLHEIWQRHESDYTELTDRYRDALIKMISTTELYLKLPSNSYQGRTFTIYVEPMGASSETNARNYALEYYVVITPGTSTALKLDQIRHAYLHYLVDPLVGRYAGNLAALSPLIDALRLAPMDEAFKNDPSLLAAECVIRAVEARTLSGGKATLAEQERAVNDSMAQGFALTRYFYEKLIPFEKDNVGFKNALPQMIAGIDVRKTVKEISGIEFARTADPEVLHLSRAKQGKLLISAQERLSAGDSATAEKLARQALAEKTEDQGRALFILAQVELKGNIDGARDYFEKALAATSEPQVVAWSHIYLGRILDLEDDSEGGPLRVQAVEHYKAAESASESLPEAKAAAQQGLEKPYAPPESSKQNQSEHNDEKP
ncbi:MAG: tetratricopeptide repeat protein [Acidobacteria bacterium]|nr:tetratricopeptide repeat protein [Acidobacteriota bacterium]